MGDPFSIASGVAGLVSLGLTICNGLNTYFSAIKDRGEDIESASQLLALLRSNIEIIGSSTSTLNNRYSRATQGITASLKLCQHQLEALDKVVDSLNIPNGRPNARRWQKQKAVMIYPFNRHNLLQVQDQLLKATGVLGTFVQTLILNINVNMSEDLQAVRNATNNSSLVTNDFLRSVNDSIDIIGPSIQQTETQLTTISARIDEQTTFASTTHALVHEVNLKLSTLASGVEEIRISSCANKDRSIESNSSLQLPRNVETESERNRSFLAETCNCRPSRTRPAYRRARQTPQSWGWITVSKQVELRENHRPGCPDYAVYSSNGSTTTTITYTGLRRLFSQVLDFSLVRDSRAGTCSVSSGLRTCNVVRSSPAFDVLRSDWPWGYVRQNDADVTEIVESLKEKLQLLYKSRITSPFDVDELGRNIAHHCVTAFDRIVPFEYAPERVNKGMHMLRMLLTWLSDTGVDISVADFKQRTIVDLAVDSNFGDLLPCVYDTLEECEPQLDLVMNPNGRWTRLWFQDWRPDRVQVFGEFPNIFFERVDIVQGLGYGDLFQAISQRDERKLQSILDKERLLNSLLERDFYGRNVLHLCTSWPTGLRLLLRNQATKPLLVEQDRVGLVPSDHALLSSHYACNAPDKWSPCHDCGCSAALQILMEVDCRVVITPLIGCHLSYCSLKAKRLILDHLRQRRERLLRVALNSLSLTDLQDLGVMAEKPSDTTAKELWDKLRERGVEPEDALNPRWCDIPPDHGGLFFCISCPKVAELAFNMGFEDIDAPTTFGLTPILTIKLILEDPTDVGPWKYALWLLQKGARIDRSINSFGISAAHYLARMSGIWVRRHYFNAIRSLPSELAIVFSKLFRNDQESYFPCPCTPHGLSRPVHHFLAGVLEDPRARSLRHERCRPYRAKVQLAMQLVDILTYAVDGLDLRCFTTPIVRLLTLESLNIRHLPPCSCKADAWIQDGVLDSERQEEWNEMLEEDRQLIKQLDELMEEFEAEFLRQNVSITTFLRGYWLKRMRQVRRERAKPLTEDQKQGLRDAGVILGEANQSYSDLSGYLSIEGEDNCESESEDGDVRMRNLRNRRRRYGRRSG